MKLLITLFISLTLVGCSSTKQSTESSAKTISKRLDYDSDFVDFIKHKWNTTEYDKLDLEKFSRINAFYEQLKIKDENILSNKHMKRPDNNLLIAHYLDTKLRWNMFNRGSDKLTTEKVIEKSVSDLPGRNEMLAFYYKTIFVHILNNQRSIEPYKRDLNFSQLGLNKQESAIAFLSAMRHLGNQMSGYSTTKFPDNCFRAHSFLTKIPTFNGAVYYEFVFPEFEDFPIEVDKRYPKVSFKDRFIPEFEAAKTNYEKCLEIKN